jgi:ribonuclease P protein component
VVSRAVGTAVTRNRVKRRLRHLVAAEFRELAAPVDLVVRALPAAVDGDLAGDLDAALHQCLRKLAA